MSLKGINFKSNNAATAKGLLKNFKKHNPSEEADAEECIQLIKETTRPYRKAKCRNKHVKRPNQRSDAPIPIKIPRKSIPAKYLDRVF